MKLDITEIRWKTLEKYKIEENNDGSIAYTLLNDNDIVEVINGVNN